MEKQIKVQGVMYDVLLLGDDGRGSRLYLWVGQDKVVNEKYDPATGEHVEFNDDVEGWGYTNKDSLIR